MARRPRPWRIPHNDMNFGGPQNLLCPHFSNEETEFQRPADFPNIKSYLNWLGPSPTVSMTSVVVQTAISLHWTTLNALGAGAPSGLKLPTSLSDLVYTMMLSPRRQSLSRVEGRFLMMSLFTLPHPPTLNATRTVMTVTRTHANPSPSSLLLLSHLTL